MLRGLRQVSDHAAIFFLALVVRCAVGFTFFGGQDLLNQVGAATGLVSGNEYRDAPYLPGIQLFIWVGGIVAARTSWPLAFGFKLVPILCDAMLAVVISDICRRRGSPRDGWIGGALYALCPIAVLITAGQVQWEPVFFLFVLMAFELKDRPGFGWRMLAGALFGAAVVVKPVPLLLLPLMLSRPKKSVTSVVYLRRELTKLAGLAVFAAGYVALATAAKYPVLDAIPLMLNYAKEGWAHQLPLLHGLPFEALRQNRLIVLGAVVPIWFAYLWGKLDEHAAALLIFGVVIGTCPLAPQYLAWLLPFAIILRRYVFLAVYDVIVVGFFLLFVTNPKAAPFPYENTATLAPLRALRWLAPTLANADEKMPALRFLADWAIPLSALALVVSFVVLAVFTRGGPSLVNPPVKVARNGPWAYAVFVFVMGTGLYFVAHMKPMTGPEFHEMIAAKLTRYEVISKANGLTLPESYEQKKGTRTDARALGTDWAFVFSGVVLLLAGMAALQGRGALAFRLRKQAPSRVTESARP